MKSKTKLAIDGIRANISHVVEGLIDTANQIKDANEIRDNEQSYKVLFSYHKQLDYFNHEFIQLISAFNELKDELVEENKKISDEVLTKLGVE